MRFAVPSAQLEELYNFTQLSMRLVSPGIRGYLNFNEDYSSFLTMAQAVPAYNLLLNGPWAQVQPLPLLLPSPVFFMPSLNRKQNSTLFSLKS